MKRKPLIITLVVAFSIIIISAGAYAILTNSDDSSNSSNLTTESKNCVTYNDTVGRQCAEDYEGMNISEAVDEAESSGLQPVITVVNGENQGFTDIFRSAPIYFETSDGIVTKAFFEDDRPAYE